MNVDVLKAPASEPEKRGRKASKETRRQQLIEATIDSLAKRGYAETTMADVADGAGLSRGIVNFHFESKEKLLVATLQYMADEYSVHWRSALQKAGDDPARQLGALVAADFDRSICNRRKRRHGAPSGARPSRGQPTRRCAAPAMKAIRTSSSISAAGSRPTAATISMRTPRRLD